MSIKIWKILGRGVLPDGQKHQAYEYIIVDSFHIRKTNEYVPIASEPLDREDILQLITTEIGLDDFELDGENAEKYSDEDWELAEQLEEDEWELILKELS